MLLLKGARDAQRSSLPHYGASQKTNAKFGSVEQWSHIIVSSEEQANLLVCYSFQLRVLVD